MPDMKNPAVLIKAFNKLGWQVVTKAKTRTWGSNSDRNKIYEWVAKNPNDGYDLGIVRDAKGNLTIEGDTSMMGQDVWNCLGTGFEKLKQEYSLENLSAWASQFTDSAFTREATVNGVTEVEIEAEIEIFQ